MAHIITPEAEAILDQPITIHEKGFIRLVDYMGGDNRIVQSARVSYGAGTKTHRDDEKLIHYLLKNGHTSPFEQVILTFHCKMPIFIARQWLRHRTARVNEISGRYSVMQAEFYIPHEDDIAIQSMNNKQGRSTKLSQQEAVTIQKLLKEEQEDAYTAYQDKLDNHNLARELARINLPLSLYTEIYWQIDLHNLFHFLRLRMHSHAQKEIRDYAEAIFSVTQRVAPIACSAFQQYQLESITLDAKERQELQSVLEESKLSPELYKKLFS
ncbi:FAD-dependent thymidylate synthase [Entomospira entomophila]|uniref:Flavin-dependent thymidylate synthase n=1 Tax=Entomospira entomophila TaxID=2719988 RepID=A0A968G8K5_9SPIO|nr:FAD-dependent thymidylate synthase [Entomospira entomophilus]NIZ40548.1 FAD-dependent thymidylate synthase [Entomospira entomophilus]WDI36106.1 FAD-dependent thymidylate synthase [Entomospira entomophilus]